jgi:cell division septation protein DedD
MEPALKQRLLGAAVLVALAVVFLPLLVMDPAPDSGASSVPLRVPAAPDAGGDTQTLDLPLAAPATGAPVLPAPAPPAASDATEAPAPDPGASANVAAGNYAVNFGSYATESDASRVIAALSAAHLPAFQQAAPLGTRTVHRVRIGPYATSAAAEGARIAAGRVRSDVNARVVVLDAGTGPAPDATTDVAPPTSAPANGAMQVSTAPRNAPATPAAPVAASTTVTAGTDRPTSPAAATPPAPAAPPAPAPAANPAAAHVGFAVQLGAFANPDEATRLRDRARAAGFSAFVEQVRTEHGTLSRVRVGPTPDRAAADALRAQVASKLGVSGIVRPHP